MINNSRQKNIDINGNNNKIVGGNDNSSTNNYYVNSNSKLSTLFDKLKERFENDNKIESLSNNLKRYTERRDTIGLEQKLINAEKEYLYRDFAWCKQEFHKKLTLYQNYEPAQEICRKN